MGSSNTCYKSHYKSIKDEINSLINAFKFLSFSLEKKGHFWQHCMRRFFTFWLRLGYVIIYNSKIFVENSRNYTLKVRNNHEFCE